jgi:hypothetical protein
MRNLILGRPGPGRSAHATHQPPAPAEPVHQPLTEGPHGLASPTLHMPRSIALTPLALSLLHVPAAGHCTP